MLQWCSKFQHSSIYRMENITWTNFYFHPQFGNFVQEFFLHKVFGEKLHGFLPFFNQIVFSSAIWHQRAKEKALVQIIDLNLSHILYFLNFIQHSLSKKLLYLYMCISCFEVFFLETWFYILRKIEEMKIFTYGFNFIWKIWKNP